jgi:hypothetical protein
MRPMALAVLGVLLLEWTPAAAQQTDESSSDSNESSSTGDARSTANGTGMRAEVAGGPALRTLFGLNIWGGDADAALGGQLRHGIGLYGRATYFLGSTEAGLTTQELSLGPHIDVRVDGGLHLGGGTELVYFDIARASGRDGDSISTWGVGLEGCARYFIYEAVPYAVFVEGRADYLSLDTFHDPAQMWGLSLSGGVRF